MTGFRTKAIACLAIATSVQAGVCASPAFADKIANKIAVFAFLDKVTARISTKAIPLNTTVQFGSLKVTPRACFSRPATEQPQTTTFVEVIDQKLDGTSQQIFSGWMLAQSPGLNAVEHPVYDVWLTDCQKPTGAVAAVAKALAPIDPAAPDSADLTDPVAPDAVPVKKHRFKRQ